MKKTIVAVSALLISSAASAEGPDIITKVDRAILFQTTAEVHRSASVNVGRGRSKLVFGGIPQNINPDSLKVRGQSEGKLTISGVELKPKRLGEDVSKYAAELQLKIKGVERGLKSLALQKNRILGQREALKSIRVDSPSPDAKQALRPRTPEEMGKILAFISDSGSKLDAEEGSIDEKTGDLNDELSRLKAELSDVQSGGSVETVIEVSVSSDKPSEAQMELSYQISDAGWRPTYNFNFASGGKEPEFVLDTYAVASQNTGEDWIDVELVFSTARNEIGLNRPSASPRILDIFEPVPIMGDGVGFRAKASVMSAPEAASGAPSAVAGAEPMQAEEELAQVSALGVISFKIPGKTSLKSGGSVEKFKISEAKLKGEVRNTVIPTMSSLVFREAKLQNNMDQPLLPGEIAVFSDGSFVGKQFIGYTPQNKELSLSIGLSDDISVSRKQTKKFEDDSGLVRTVRRLQNAYEIEVENHGAEPAEIHLIEPAPISRNDKIKVTMGSVSPAPLPAGDDRRVQKGEGILEWVLSVPANGKSKASYDSSVEFAQGINVSGTENL